MYNFQARPRRADGISGNALLRQAPELLARVNATIVPEEIEQIDLLIRVMSAFDRDTAEHLEIVGTYSMLLAQYVEMPAEIVANCLSAGRVHDIGKLAISRSLLTKPGRPTPDEWAELKLHPVFGGSTLAGLPRLARLAPYVISHHERIDGHGYPNRLAGEEIPIESQVIAITDAFCAMTVPRPYCDTRMPSEALAELERCAGSQFNADLVEAFVEMFREPALSAVPPIA